MKKIDGFFGFATSENELRLIFSMLSWKKNDINDENQPESREIYKAKQKNR